MNCPTCNANLPDSASFCYSCGSSISSGSFSYLPSGTPPWPTPDKFAQTSLYVVDTIEARTLPAEQSTEHAEGADGAASAAKPKRSARSILTIVAVLALSALFGVGISLGSLWSNGLLVAGTSRTPARVLPPPAHAAATATPSTSSSPSASSSAFATLNSTDLGISMKYPANWVKRGPQQASADTLFVDFAPPQALGIEFVLKRISGSTSAKFSGTSAANQANLTEFNSITQVHNLQPTQASQPTIAGVQWDEEDATFTDDNGTSYRFVTIAVQHNKVYYTISFFAPQATYSASMQQYIQPMLNSLTFLS
jgi:hypothetical protein